MTIDDVKRAARRTNDENGQPVIVIPLVIWEAYLAEVEQKNKPPTDKQVKAVLDEIQALASETPPEWWDEFDEFMKANRITFEHTHPKIVEEA